MSLISAGPCEVTFLSPLTAKQAQDLRGCVATQRRAGAQRALVLLVLQGSCPLCVAHAPAWCTRAWCRRAWCVLGRGAHMWCVLGRGACAVGWELVLVWPCQEACEACGSFLSVTGQLPCDTATTLLGTCQEVTTGHPTLHVGVLHSISAVQSSGAAHQQ